MPKVVTGGRTAINSTAQVQGLINTAISFQNYIDFAAATGDDRFRISNGATGDFYPLISGRVDNTAYASLYFLGDNTSGTSATSGIITFDGRVGGTTAIATDVLMEIVSGAGGRRFHIMGDGKAFFINDVDTTGNITAANFTGSSSGANTGDETKASIDALNVDADTLDGLDSLAFELAFTKNTAFNKDFGTASGTVAEGDDIRINNGQTAFGWGDHAGLYSLVSHTHAFSEITSTPTTLVGYGISDTKANYNTSLSDGNFLFDGDVVSFPGFDTLFNDYGYVEPTHAFGDLTSTPTTLLGYGISDTKANFDTALSDGTFLYDGDVVSFPGFDTLFNDYGYVEPTHAFGDLTSTPTTLAGYGISDSKLNYNTSLSDGTFMFTGDVPTAHTHTLAEGATDVTATFAELNLLDLSGLTVGWILSADSASTASWKAPTGGSGSQTFISSSELTAHTLTLSDSGGSVKFIEGTGVTLTTSGTALDAELIITAAYTEINDLTAAVIWANVPDANITETSVTQHEAALSIGWSQVTSTPTTLAGYGISDTMANFDTALSDGTFIYEGDSRLTDARPPTSHTLLSHTISGETIGHVLAADSPTTYSIRQLLGSEISNTESWAADQTSIVGISGTKSEFNTELTDGDFLFSGDVVSFPGWGSVTDHTDIASATNTDKFVLVANGTTGYVGRALLEADISDFGSYLSTGITTLAGYGISDTKANFNTALSDGTFLYDGDVVSFPGFTDLLTDYGFTDNSVNWNTAFGWGDWAGHTHPKSDITDFAHTHEIADVLDFTDNSANWDTAFGWGDHAGLYSLTGHSHLEADITDLGPYDNYQSFNLKTNGVQRTTIVSNGEVDIVAGTDISVVYSAGGVVTINNAVTQNTAYNKNFGTIAGTVTEGDVFTSHKNGDGSDHTFINQDVTIGSSPTFNGQNITGVSASAGQGLSYYLGDNIVSGDNLDLTTTPAGGAEVEIQTTVAAADGIKFIERFVTDGLNVDSLPAGTWIFRNYLSVDSSSGASIVHVRLNKRVLKPGTVTTTGTGITRTFTATDGGTFVSGDANASILEATLIETPTETFWIDSFASDTVVTAVTDQAGYINESGVTFYLYYLQFRITTDIITEVEPKLFINELVHSEIPMDPADEMLLAYFIETTSNPNRIVSLYKNGSEHYSYLQTPLIIKHNSLDGLNEGEYQHLTIAEKATVDSALQPGDIGVTVEAYNANIQTHIGDVTTNPHSVNATDVGLSNVDNTSDADKPVSTDTQTALDLKSDTTHNHNGQTIVVGDHGTESVDEVVNVCYGTSATPPSAGTVTEGALYIQYTP